MEEARRRRHTLNATKAAHTLNRQLTRGPKQAKRSHSHTRGADLCGESTNKSRSWELTKAAGTQPPTSYTRKAKRKRLRGVKRRVRGSATALQDFNTLSTFGKTFVKFA